VHLWMIDQHLGRRSISDFVRGVLALRKKDIVTERRARTANASSATADADAPASSAASSDDASVPPPAPLNSREAIAKAARISSTQVQMIEKIQKQAAPEVVAAVKSGTISINAAAAVASLPAEEQVAAANAGKDELKLAAKRAREAKRKPREDDAEASSDSESPFEAPDSEQVQALKQRVAALKTENKALREQIATLQLQLAAA